MTDIPSTPPFDMEAALTAWDEAKRNMDAWTIKERALRQQIFAVAFPEPKVGTNKLKISHGMALIGDYRINYRIDKPLLEAMANDPKIVPVIAEVIAYRPEVKDGAWRKLPTTDKMLIAEAITETPGLPGIELKPQNKVRW